MIIAFRWLLLTNYYILLSVLGLRAIRLKEIFLTDQNVVKANCSNIVFVFLFSRHIQDPASQRLTWNKPPKSVLVIKKIRDASLLQPFKELCVYLTEVIKCKFHFCCTLKSKLASVTDFVEHGMNRIAQFKQIFILAPTGSSKTCFGV